MKLIKLFKNPVEDMTKVRDYTVSRLSWQHAKELANVCRANNWGYAYVSTGKKLIIQDVLDPEPIRRWLDELEVTYDFTENPITYNQASISIASYAWWFSYGYICAFIPAFFIMFIVKGELPLGAFDLNVASICGILTGICLVSHQHSKKRIR